MNIIKKIGIFLGGTAIVLGAPVIPQEMKWVHSYETVMFDTIDGDLDENEFAKAGENEWYVRKLSKTAGNFETTNDLDDLIDKKEVSVNCEKCAYYAEFSDSGSIKRVVMEKSDYDGLRSIKNYEQPTRKKFGSLLNNIGQVEAQVALDTSTEDSNVCVTTVSSIAWTHTMSGSNTLLAVNSTTASATDANRFPKDKTYNSIEMATSTYTNEGATNNISAFSFHLVNPSDGANTITLTYTGTVSTACGYSISFTGVDQQNPVSNTVSRVLSNSDLFVIGTSTPIINNTVWLTDLAHVNTGAVEPGNGQTEQQTRSTGISAISTKIIPIQEATTTSWTEDLTEDTTDDWLGGMMQVLPVFTTPYVTTSRTDIASSIVGGATITGSDQSTANMNSDAVIGGTGTSHRITGFRFSSVIVPVGSTITTATITFTANLTDSTPAVVRIFTEASDNPVTFDTSTNEPQDRATTTEGVDWSLPNQTLGNLVTSPDISTEIQSVINRGGWASGNAIVILFGNDGVLNVQNARNSIGSAVLSITYSEATTGGEAPRPAPIWFDGGVWNWIKKAEAFK